MGGTIAPSSSLALADGPPLILASASRVRARILREAGIPARVSAARVDESEVKNSLAAAGADAARAAETLAEMKAVRVSAKHPGALVIGADQILECEGSWFDKPRDMDQATAHLRALQGRRHTLWTGVCLVRDGTRIWHHGAAAHLTMRALGDDFIARYLAALGAAALDSVGAYQIEGLGAHLFARSEGDHFAILGLPLLPLLDMLRANGIMAR